MTPEEEKDIGDLIELLGKTIMVEGGHKAQKNFLVNGLCELIDADGWAWMLSNHPEPESRQTIAAILVGKFDQDQLTKLNLAIEHPDSSKATALFYKEAQETMVQTTLDNNDMDPKDFAHQGELRVLWLNTGLGATILSGLYVDNESISLIGLYRSAEKPQFTEWEKKRVDMVLSRVDFLHKSGWPEDRGISVAQLAPRHRKVFYLIANKYSRKEGADKMGISENTFNEYAKELYKLLGIKSKKDLIHRYLHGDD